MKEANFKITPDLYASKGSRFANYMVDYIIRIIVGIILVILITFISETVGSYGVYEFLVESESKLSDYILGIIMVLIYFNIIESLTAKSVGKYITKTRVVMEDGSKPKFTDVFLRTLCRLIPFEAFSFLGDEGRGWHDSISNTYVVDEKLFKAKKASINSLDQIGKQLEE